MNVRVGLYSSLVPLAVYDLSLLSFEQWFVTFAFLYFHLAAIYRIVWVPVCLIPSSNFYDTARLCNFQGISVNQTSLKRYNKLENRVSNFLSDP
jgi:hypothetical protein